MSWIAHAWSYTLAADEMLPGRENRRARQHAGSGRIPDPRRFVLRRGLHRARERGGHVLGPRDRFHGTARWFDADRGLPRSASSAPVVSAAPCRCRPAPVVPTRSVLRACSTSASSQLRGRDQPMPGCGSHCSAVNKVFTVGERYRPLAVPVLTGRAAFRSPLDGDWHEFPIRNGDAPLASIGAVL